MNSIENTNKETHKHRINVHSYLLRVMMILAKKAEVHDLSKMESPEVEIFAEYAPKLKTTTYGSDEYKGYLKEMGKALDHHYKENRHHPEHFEDGIKGMNLMDLLEMLCDWMAATMRHDDGDIHKSIEINQKRFGYSDEMKQAFLNTVRDW